MYELVAAQQRKLLESIAGLVAAEEGQDMIEYALLAALISIVAIAMILLVGPQLDLLFQDITNGLFPR